MHFKTGLFGRAAVVDAAKYCQPLRLQQGFQSLDGFPQKYRGC
jgi:hypothetical protein